MTTAAEEVGELMDGDGRSFGVFWVFLTKDSCLAVKEGSDDLMATDGLIAMEGSKAIATAVNLTALEGSTVTATAMDGWMATATATAVE